MKIHVMIMHNAITLTFADFSIVIICATAFVLSVVLATASVLTRISPADSTLCKNKMSGSLKVPYVGLQRNIDINMPHGSSYACSNSTGKDSISKLSFC